MLVLSNEEIEQLLTMQDCIEVLEELYYDLAQGQAGSSPRVDNLAPCSREDAYYAFKQMGGTWPAKRVQALRINSDIITHPPIRGNRRRVKVPAANGRWVGLVELFSTDTGELLAIYPDGVVQRMRVGATSGIAAKQLSRPDSSRVGLIGSGWQAGTQLMAITAVRPITEVKVYSPNPDSREEFAREYAAKLGIRVSAVDGPEECVDGVDVIAAATSSMVPVIRPEFLKPGMHVSCIKTQEVDGQVLAKCGRVVVHTKEQGKQLDNIIDGTPNVLPEHLEGWWSTVRWHELSDLSDLASGKISGRSSAAEITCFVNNVGLGLQFAATGALILAKAKETEAGRELPGEWFTESVHP